MSGMSRTCGGSGAKRAHLSAHDTRDAQRRDVEEDGRTGGNEAAVRGPVRGRNGICEARANVDRRPGRDSAASVPGQRPS